MYYVAAPLILSLIVSLLLGKILIPILKSKKLGQKILDIGPRWHKSKEGTPNLGGLLFISGSLCAMLVFGISLRAGGSDIRVILTYGMALAFGLIGFIDDYTKLMKKQNKGLTPNQKLVLQFTVGIIYLFLMERTGYLSTEVFIPFIKINIELGVFFYILALLGIVFITNSVNLTDGIDGLCGSVTFIVMIFYTAVFSRLEITAGVMLGSAMIGGLLGYLYYNFYPAKVIMGDTGSLFLGGMICGMAFWLDMPIILLIIGIIYVIEALSVVIQVTSFKLTKKRIFKMSPIHHHFEMCGWSEVKIVAVFGMVTLICCAAAYLGILD